MFLQGTSFITARDCLPFPSRSLRSCKVSRRAIVKKDGADGHAVAHAAVQATEADGISPSPRSMPDGINLVSFYIPAKSADSELRLEERLPVKSLRAQLTAQASPFLGSDTAFFTDDDGCAVALNALHVGSQSHLNNLDMCMDMLSTDGTDLDTLRFPTTNADATTNTITEHDRKYGHDGDGSNDAGGAPSTSSPPAASGMTAGSSEFASDVEEHIGHRACYKSVVPTPEQLGIRRLCVRLPPWAVCAGPRKTIYFNPKTVNAAIVTCGGLCPGLKDVVQGLVHRLSDYGVPDGNILGIRYGVQGFYACDNRPVVLTRESVEGIHLLGGTVLGTARGGADIPTIVAKLKLWEINMLFVVGGDGGNKCAEAIRHECEQRHVLCCVVGVPKSIDNDILLIDNTFGADTAVQKAQDALAAAQVEATSAYQGIGLVKLMGRSSGYLAMAASMAANNVDVCLIPEVPFRLEGPRGLVEYLQHVLGTQGHAVVCVAEGAGQDLIHTNDGTAPEFDASGNPRLKDIGAFLKKALKPHFPHADIKYIDPTYMIRAIPSASNDRVLCKVLSFNAVDAAFAGFTGVTVAKVNGHFALLPQAPRLVDPFGRKWQRLCESIGQPFAFI